MKVVLISILALSLIGCSGHIGIGANWQAEAEWEMQEDS